MNNFLNDSLQEEDDNRNATNNSALEVEAVEVEVEDQSENFQKTDELQKVLFPEMNS